MWNRNGKGRHADAHRPILIAVSFRRLFLGGLLPSRARLRFAGSTTYTSSHEAGAIPRRPTCPQFPRLTEGVHPTCARSDPPNGDHATSLGGILARSFCHGSARLLLW
jgi:hypothetical protein